VRKDHTIAQCHHHSLTSSPDFPVYSHESTTDERVSRVMNSRS